MFQGPTLLFSRGSDNKKFYSCSAHRDRKKCSFFVWENQIESIGQQFMDQYERDLIVTKMMRYKLQSKWLSLIYLITFDLTAIYKKVIC